MRVLVLGASGFIGNGLMQHLAQCAGWQALGASRRGPSIQALPGSLPWRCLRLDILDADALMRALADCDAVVNAVAGSERAIAGGARVLAEALRRCASDTGRAPALVHLSSMAVYQGLEGPVDEATPLRQARGWYARAKQASETALGALAREGQSVTLLRPGCVWGPGSPLWVARIAQWLHSGRLGDLGEHGDGWTHGLHVNDVCQAVLLALRHPAEAGQVRCLNLAAPDSPRWNTWFVDLAQATSAPTPRRLSLWQLRLDAWGAAPVLALASRVAPMLVPGLACPPPMPPGLLALWRSQLRMEASLAVRELGLRWTPYSASLAQGAAWWLARQATRAARARNRGLPIT